MLVYKINGTIEYFNDVKKLSDDSKHTKKSDDFKYIKASNIIFSNAVRAIRSSKEQILEVILTLMNIKISAVENSSSIQSKIDDNLKKIQDNFGSTIVLYIDELSKSSHKKKFNLLQDEIKKNLQPTDDTILPKLIGGIIQLGVGIKTDLSINESMKKAFKLKDTFNLNDTLNTVNFMQEFISKTNIQNCLYTLDNNKRINDIEKIEKVLKCITDKNINNRRKTFDDISTHIDKTIENIRSNMTTDSKIDTALSDIIYDIDDEQVQKPTTSNEPIKDTKLVNPPVEPSTDKQTNKSSNEPIKDTKLVNPPVEPSTDKQTTVVSANMVTNMSQQVSSPKEVIIPRSVIEEQIKQRKKREREQVENEQNMAKNDRINRQILANKLKQIISKTKTPQQNTNDPTMMITFMGFVCFMIFIGFFLFRMNNK